MNWKKKAFKANKNLQLHSVTQDQLTQIEQAIADTPESIRPTNDVYVLRSRRLVSRGKIKQIANGRVQLAKGLRHFKKIEESGAAVIASNKSMGAYGPLWLRPVK